MIIDYDRRPNATEQDRLQSLIASVMMALNEKADQAAVDSYVKKLADEIKKKSGGGSGSVSSYEDLDDLPQIEGVTLTGNKYFPQLNLGVLSNEDIEDIFTNLI